MMRLRFTPSPRTSSAGSLENEDTSDLPLSPPVEDTSDSPLSPPVTEDNKRKRGNVNYIDTIPSDDEVSNQLEGSATMSSPSRPSKRAKTDAEFNVDRQLTPSDSEDPASSVESPVKEKGIKKRKAAKKLAGQRKPAKKAVKEAYHLDVQTGKPEPFGEPPAWAFKRQQLCETLPYYRAYDGAAYTNEGILYAMLIDREVGVRDQFTDQIIITKWYILPCFPFETSG